MVGTALTRLCPPYNLVIASEAKQSTFLLAAL